MLQRVERLKKNVGYTILKFCNLYKAVKNFFFWRFCDFLEILQLQYPFPPLTTLTKKQHQNLHQNANSKHQVKKEEEEGGGNQLLQVYDFCNTTKARVSWVDKLENCCSLFFRGYVGRYRGSTHCKGDQR